MNPEYIAGSWASICRTAQSHALMMGQQCATEFADLMTEEAAKLCREPAPTTSEQLSDCYMKSMALTSKIGSISHADQMAKRSPQAAEKLLQLTRDFCSRVPLDRRVYGESFALSSEILSLCSC
jgi:hypothetical protein